MYGMIFVCLFVCLFVYHTVVYDSKVNHLLFKKHNMAFHAFYTSSPTPQFPSLVAVAYSCFFLPAYSILSEDRRTGNNKISSSETRIKQVGFLLFCL